MLDFLLNIFRTTAKSQGSDKMREADVEDSRKVTRRQDKVRTQYLRLEALIAVIFMFFD